MILQLAIEKLDSGIYEAHCDLSQPTCHGSISEALKYYGGDIPPDLCQFVDVQYGGVSLGTTAVSRLASEPEALASRLTGLVAAVRQAEEEIEYRRASSPKAAG